MNAAHPGAISKNGLITMQTMPQRPAENSKHWSARIRSVSSKKFSLPDQQERSRMGYWTMVVFFFVYYLRPGDIIPGIATLHLAKIAAFFAILALLLGANRLHSRKIPIEIKIILVTFVWLIITIPFASVRLLMENFADPAVGTVSGELMLGNPATGETGRGMGLYWQIEKLVRQPESTSGSVVGATGAIYSVRRELVPEVPPDTILDNVFIPPHVAKQGYRVWFDVRTRAWHDPDLGAESEFRRKMLTFSGNYQLLQLATWLRRNVNPLRYALISRKLLRLIVPFALIAALGSAWFIPETFCRTAFWRQVGFRLLGFSGWKLRPLSRLSDIAYTFIALNAAALVAFSKFITAQKAVWMHAPVPEEAHLR
jgi:hypothetical protein